MSALTGSSIGTVKTRMRIDVLIDKLKGHRAAHIEEYELAHKLFLNDLEVRLKRALKEVKRGQPPSMDFTTTLMRPRDNSHKYDELINTFTELSSTISEIELDFDQLNRILNDGWQW